MKSTLVDAGPLIALMDLQKIYIDITSNTM